MSYISQNAFHAPSLSLGTLHMTFFPPEYPSSLHPQNFYLSLRIQLRQHPLQEAFPLPTPQFDRCLSRVFQSPLALVFSYMWPLGTTAGAEREGEQWSWVMYSLLTLCFVTAGWLCPLPMATAPARQCSRCAAKHPLPFARQAEDCLLGLPGFLAPENYGVFPTPYPHLYK